MFSVRLFDILIKLIINAVPVVNPTQIYPLRQEIRLRNKSFTPVLVNFTFFLQLTRNIFVIPFNDVLLGKMVYIAVEK